MYTHSIISQDMKHRGTAVIGAGRCPAPLPSRAAASRAAAAAPLLVYDLCQHPHLLPQLLVVTVAFVRLLVALQRLQCWR